MSIDVCFEFAGCLLFHLSGHCVLGFSFFKPPETHEGLINDFR